MASTEKYPLGDLELTGEYLEAMKQISAHLMSSLPESDDLWRILGETETLLLEAQITGTPLSKLFGKGGVAGFCQSIIDEKGGVLSEKDMTNSASLSKAPPKKQRRTGNAHIRRKKNIVTGCIIGVWVLLIAVLVGQYIGFVRYLFHPQTFYLEELHNFEAQVTPLEDTDRQITLTISQGSLGSEIIYAQDDHRVTLTQMGVDEITVDKKVICRWWVELAYTQDTEFSKITYVAPDHSGTAVVSISSDEEMTNSLTWQGEGRYDDGRAYVRLCFLEVPKDTDLRGGKVQLHLDDMKLVSWHRIGVGKRAK